MDAETLRPVFNRYLQRVKDDWNYITPQVLKQELEENGDEYFLLDVRKPDDYVKGHVPGSLNIFWLDLFKSNNYSRLPRDKTIVVICYVGHTASQILTLLKLLGFNAVGLKFGIGVTPVEGVPVASWSQFGFPMEHHHDEDGLCRLPEQQGGRGRRDKGGLIGYTEELIELTRQNENYRKVLYTTPQQQLVVMAIPYLVEIGMERHPTTTQFIQIVSGRALAYVDENRYKLGPGSTLVIPPGANHNVISTSKKGLKLFTIYSPPEHADGLIQREKI